MLPGMTPFMAAVPFAMPVFATALSATPSVNWPAGVQSGDFALLFSSARKGTNSNPTAVTPGGFTAVYNETTGLGNNNTGRTMVYRRICDGSETGTITALNDDTEGTILVVYRPTKPITGATGFAPNKNGDAGNVSPLTVDPTGQAAPALSFGMRLSPSGGTPLSVPAGAALYETANVDAGVYLMLRAEDLQITAWDIGDNGNWNGLFVGGIALTITA